MINLIELINHLNKTPLKEWAQTLPNRVEEKLTQEHGDFPRWQAVLNELPELVATHIDLTQDFTINGQVTSEQRQQLEQTLRKLIPWRKGPFKLFDIHIDTEWHSDWKWQRVSPHIDLTDKRILDVGCGNGYYQWRMLGAGARYVLGIDPNLLFLCQFHAIKKYLPDYPLWILPFTLDDFPTQSESFDVTFSMGVFYHRRSPIDHLLELKDTLVKGGQLVLETLVIDGDAQQVLVPDDRYAQMRNVWFLPSIEALTRWLKRTGFSNIRCVDVNQTSIQEQRATDWMTFKSLPDFLNPNDHSLTIEGLPAPKRAVFIASK